MKSPKNFYSRLAIITSVILVTGYFIVNAAYTTLVLSDANSGKTVTSTLVQTIMNNIIDLDARVTALISSVGGGPAGEATKSSSFSVPTGGNTTITNLTVNTPVTIGGGFNPTTGVFQPTIAGRYLFNVSAYSNTSTNWAVLISKNNTIGMQQGSNNVAGNGNIASTSYVANLNGANDFIVFAISNYAGTTATLTSSIVTWTKLP